MSKGHGCLAQYVMLEDLGVLGDDMYDRCRVQSDRPKAHATRIPTPAPAIRRPTASLRYARSRDARRMLADRFDRQIERRSSSPARPDPRA